MKIVTVSASAALLLVLAAPADARTPKHLAPHLKPTGDVATLRLGSVPVKERPQLLRTLATASLPRKMVVTFDGVSRRDRRLALRALWTQPTGDPVTRMGIERLTNMDQVERDQTEGPTLVGRKGAQSTTLRARGTGAGVAVGLSDARDGKQVGKMAIGIPGDKKRPVTYVDPK